MRVTAQLNVLVARRYRLGPVLGHGGMGELYRATDELLGRSVAVKLLWPLVQDPSAADGFHRGPCTAAMLNHPHVVAVYDFGGDGKDLFLVMELVGGHTVADVLARHGLLPTYWAVDIVEQAAEGLAAAHRQDVVHRDIKPGNCWSRAMGSSRSQTSASPGRPASRRQR